MANKIVKVAENNVEYTKSRTVTDINGVDFEAWGETESFGQENLTRLIALTAQALTDAKNFDEKAYKDRRIVDTQALVDKFAAIQAEMHK